VARPVKMHWQSQWHPAEHWQSQWHPALASRVSGRSTKCATPILRPGMNLPLTLTIVVHRLAPESAAYTRLHSNGSQPLSAPQPEAMKAAPIMPSKSGSIHFSQTLSIRTSSGRHSGSYKIRRALPTA